MIFNNCFKRVVNPNGFLGWYHNIGECLLKYPMPRIGYSFVNIETRSLWIHDGVAWQNSTQGNPFMMITNPAEAGAVREGYSQSFYYIAVEDGDIAFTFKVDGATQTVGVKDVKVSDVVFISWTGNKFETSVSRLQPNLVRFVDGLFYDVDGNEIKHLSSDKFLRFNKTLSGEVAVNTTSGVTRSGESIFYIPNHNVFAIEKNGIYYSVWSTTADPTESTRYNKGNAFSGFSAREDNVYIDELGNIFVFTSNGLYPISILGSKLKLLEDNATSQFALHQNAINTEVKRATQAEEQIEANLDAEVTRATAAEGALLSANKFLPFSAINTDLDVTLQMASITRSGEPIFYIQKHNVFAIEKNGLYYPAWGTTADMTESLKYNNGNGTVGYTAREDNVYIAEINDMYVIIDGFVALVTNIGTMLDVARTSLGWQIAGIKDNIEDLLSRVEALETQLA